MSVLYGFANLEALLFPTNMSAQPSKSGEQRVDCFLWSTKFSSFIGNLQFRAKACEWID
eukprot:jgi/Psemu1/301116/fgenesh1_kg.26_\